MSWQTCIVLVSLIWGSVAIVGFAALITKKSNSKEEKEDEG